MNRVFKFKDGSRSFYKRDADHDPNGELCGQCDQGNCLFKSEFLDLVIRTGVSCLIKECPHCRPRSGVAVVDIESVVAE